MSNRDIGIAVIVGSQILGLLRILPANERSKGAYINYTQHIKSKIYVVKSPDRPKWAEICHDSLISLLDKGFDKSITMATLVESLSFTFEKELISFYGVEYFPRMLRFCNKHSHEYTSDYAKDSYKVADALADAVRKHFYDKGLR